MIVVPLFASFVTTLFGLALTLTAVFLILLVLVQRGRGGGLAGALGGMGGSSAFGAKAGDIFTRITIGAASVWIVLCIAAAKYSAPTSSRININVDNPVNSQTGDSATSPLDTEQEKEGTAASDPRSADTGTADTGTADTGTADTGAAGTGTADTGAASTGDNSSLAIQPSDGGSASSTEDSAQAPPVDQSPASPE